MSKPLITITVTEDQAREHFRENINRHGDVLVTEDEFIARVRADVDADLEWAGVDSRDSIMHAMSRCIGEDDFDSTVDIF